MQPYLFPYVGYFQLIKHSDVFISYEYVQFMKRSWITRNRILDKGKGEPIYISIPVRKQSPNKLIYDVLIDEQKDWRSELLNLVYYNYKKAKYFEEMYAFIKEILSFESEKIYKLNTHLITSICSKLNISSSKIIDANEFGPEIESNILDEIESASVDLKTLRIIKMCKYFGADSYLNPVGGSAIYHLNDFKKHDINLIFQKINDHSYNQFNGSFEKRLSIVDALMHVGFSGVNSMISKPDFVDD